MIWKIAKITMDEPYQKEFVTMFKRPVLKGEYLHYTMEYDLEEPKRYFENAFLTDCKKFVLSFEYPQSSSISVPIVYEVNQETDEKKKQQLRLSSIEKEIVVFLNGPRIM
jgi:hypothetical protein